MIKETEEYILEHLDEYETADHVDWNERDDVGYQVMFNKRYSYEEREANAKEGWIDVRITNGYEVLEKSQFSMPRSYYIYENGKPTIAHTKLYGDVIILKVKLGTNELIKKVKSNEI